MSEMDMEDKEYKAKILRFDYSTEDLIAELERRGAIPVIFRGKGGLTDISGSRDFSDAANFQLLLIPEPDFKEAK